jgi:lipid-A-disaccharide synthase
MSRSDSIFVSAGDPSADFPGKNLIDEILNIAPDLDVFGLGGPMMQKAGLESMVDHSDLAVMGFWEILPRMLFFRKLLNRVAAEIESRRPRAVVLLDYPGFNLRLAEKIKTLDIPIIYYISPQVWAWGKRRVHDIKRLIDLMLVIFPFEESFYREHGVNTLFTGHPIVDRYRDIPDKASCRKDIGVEDDKQLIALLPGSRLQEVNRMLPVMIDAAALIGKAMDKGEFVTAGMDNIDSDVYRDAIGSKSISLINGKTPEIINAADIVITSSGTATIETAYFTTPMVIVYKTGFFTYQIARRLVDLDFIGMVNIVAGRKSVPELIQNRATAKAIASHALKIVNDPQLYKRMIDDLKTVRDKLGSGGAGRKAAEAICEAAGIC